MCTERKATGLFVLVSFLFATMMIRFFYCYFSSFQEVTYPQNDIWKPDIALKNSVNDYKQLGDSSINIQLGYNGNIQWVPHQVSISH